MNKFKTHIHEAKHEDYSRRRQEVQLLGILDKCTQVLRDDRIWIRNKVKEGDQEILQIFKKYLSKRPLDLSSLQVNLRKHVMKIKDKCKKDQLQRFKQNLNSVTNVTLFDRQNAPYERNSKSIPMKKNQPKLYFDDEDDINQYPTKNYSKHATSYESRVFEDISSKRKNPLSAFRVNDPIDEQQETSQQGFSYRSKSGHNRHKTSQNRCNQKTYDDRPSFPWQKPLSNNFQKKQKELLLQLYEDQTEVQTNYNKFSMPTKQTQPPLLPRQKTVPQQTIYQIQQSHIQSNVVLNTQIPSNAGSNFRTSLTYYHNQISEKIDQFKFGLHSNQCFQPPSFSVTPTANESVQKHVHFKESSVPMQSMVSNTFVNNSASRISKQQQNIFTNPELLMECRRFLEQSNHRSEERSEMSVPYHSDSRVQNSLSDTHNYADKLSLKAKDCSSDVKILHTNNSASSKKYHNNMLPNVGVVESFDTNDNDLFNNQIPDISKLYAEEVFQIIFPSDRAEISLEQYDMIVSKTFKEKQKLMKLFKLGDKNMKNILLANDFGRLLLTNCNYKPSPNPVKEIFSLIDIDRKGYFTLDDYERFLEQVIDAEDPETTGIIDLCSDLFQQADIGKSQKVQYWGLYLTRNSKEFVQFSTFLQQFEFEFEQA